MTAQQRADIANGVWLCQTCAKLVDNDQLRFNVAVLQDWKAAAEQAALAQIGKTSRWVDPTSPQAQATQATLDHMRRAALPEWDMRVSFNPQKVVLNITNNGESPGRNIQAELVPNPHGDKKATLRSAVPLTNVVIPPGRNFLLWLTSEDPPYEGTLVIRSTGRWGAEGITRWHIRLHRRDYGHRELELTVLSRTTEF
jgi:hypothetical protein